MPLLQVPKEQECIRCLSLLPVPAGEAAQWAIFGGETGILVFARLSAAPEG